MNKDQFQGILALKVVAEKKSFSAAAEELRVSPPAISKMINQLEKRMKITLLTRTTRAVSLTEAGTRFLEIAGPAMDQIMLAQESAVSMSKKPSGVLRLNMPSVFYPSFLAPFIASFSKKYPDITIDIYSEDLATDVFEKSFDAGFRHSDILAKDMVAIKMFGPIRWVAAASPNYLKEFGKLKHPKDLLNHNCIINRFGMGSNIYDRWEFSDKGKDFEVKVSGNLIFNDSTNIKKAAVDGLGVMYTGYEIIENEIKNKSLELVLPNFQTTSEGYYLYFPKKSQVSPKLRAFIDHFYEYNKKKK